MHQTDIYHGHFIDDNNIGIQRIFFISVKMHATGTERAIFTGRGIIPRHRTRVRDTGWHQFQHAVNGTGLITGSLSHSLGCAAGWRCQ